MAYTKEQILHDINENGVKFIRLQFTDLFGNIKNVGIPASQIEKALNNEVMFDGSSIEGFARIEESDMKLHPDLDTWLILPWEFEHGEKVARLICDVHKISGEPFEGDPRAILKKTLKEAEEMGFCLNIGPEPEFYLFKKDMNGNITTEVNDNGGYFDLSPVDLGENCRRDIVLTLEKMKFQVEAEHHEVGKGQHEVDFKYDEALKTADNIQTFKLVVKNVARKHNLHASFMPKPIFGEAGSGMHCNMSLFKDGKNAFFDENSENKLSEIANYFMAGILEHARATAAITNPIVNSYKRLVPGFEAPVNVAWSTSNRSCMIRIPGSRGSGTRVEIRNPDPSANPYLSIAVLLKAGLEGIKKKMDLPMEQRKNLFHLTAGEIKSLGIHNLPTDLFEAISELKNDSLILSVLGEHAAEKFISGKTQEWNEYNIQVTEWERKRYLGN